MEWSFDWLSEQPWVQVVVCLEHFYLALCGWCCVNMLCWHWCGTCMICGFQIEYSTIPLMLTSHRHGDVLLLSTMLCMKTRCCFKEQCRSSRFLFARDIVFFNFHKWNFLNFECGCLPPPKYFFPVWMVAPEVDSCRDFGSVSMWLNEFEPIVSSSNLTFLFKVYIFSSQWSLS